MNHHTKHPPGSPRDILIRLRRLEREIEQMLADVQSVNDNNPNFAKRPMDIGRYLVQLKKVRGVIQTVRAAVKRGDPMLDDDVMKPLLEDW